MLAKFTLLGVGLLSLTLPTLASPNISGGVWMNYRNVEDNARDDETKGDVADEALILYVDGVAPEGEGNWTYSAELRIGPGSFTDKDNNSSGDNFTLHKAWAGFQLDKANKLVVGKSQVPFGWKTANFWPGDMLQAAYGDQMDVGIKLISDRDRLDYSLAYYHADDWGEESTDSTDDNRHWGSSTTYRKVQTFVGDVQYEVADNHRVGLSLQAGNLQDLITADNPTDGDHSAVALYYHGQFDAFYAKGEVIRGQRTLPGAYVAKSGSAKEIENSRLAVELGYKMGDWHFVFDASWAKPDTDGNSAGTISAFSPGVSYDYGPGWIYLEYLSQNGFIDRDMKVNEGDFSALYLTLDFYF